MVQVVVFATSVFSLAPVMSSEEGNGNTYTFLDSDSVPTLTSTMAEFFVAFKGQKQLEPLIGQASWINKAEPISDHLGGSELEQGGKEVAINFTEVEAWPRPQPAAPLPVSSSHATREADPKPPEGLHIVIYSAMTRA